MEYDEIAAAIRAEGLVPRRGFHPSVEDGVPPGPGDAPAATLVLVGNAGPGMWAAFSRSREHLAGGEHPLDAWSRRVVGGLAEKLGARALFPFVGPPWLPFLRWAALAEPVWPSPIGPLVHAEHGLWHAYRGALAFAERVALPPRPAALRPCDACVDKPCLHACPVDAFGPGGYDVPACVAHIGAPAGAACMTGGCLARAACPVGRDRRYPPAQAGFHMRAFLRARTA